MSVSKPGGKGARVTPVMQQFFRAKSQHPDAILFFRMGDFYEMFYEDAVLAAELLELTLTARDKNAEGGPIPMAGVPHHAAPQYVARLLEKGRKVAICEQMADPSKVKGIVPREVVRVVTPGLVLDADVLDARTHNWLASAVRDGSSWGLALVELTTAEARACSLEDATQLLGELVRADAREVLVAEGESDMASLLGRALPRAAVRAAPSVEVTAVLEAVLGPSGALAAREALAPVALDAAARALDYAARSQPGVALGIGQVARYDPSSTLGLDESAVRNLELLRTLGGEKRGALLSVLDATSSPMGARMLRQRLLAPLTDIASIRRRHDAVEALVLDAGLRDALRAELARIGDLERLATRATLEVATPRDLGAIRDGLAAAGACVQRLLGASSALDGVLAALAPEDLCADLHASLDQALVEAPPVSARDGGIFRDGLDAELDSLRALSSSSKDVVLALEERERKRTGVASLKVRFTRVFGYYIEVTRSNLKAVPPEYRRKQTVAGAERFTTEELTGLEEKILHADDHACERELDRFLALRKEVSGHAVRLRTLASRLAELDCAAGLAHTAHRFGWTRPTVDASSTLELIEARHPVVEQLAAAGRFVPNDVTLDASGARLMILTGPNMAGKSTVMRQTALAAILAQMGAFVPAQSARIGLVDRVFTRVGASDDVSSGASTFMVEMREAAAILRGATARSLVILDEIGRGTSTYDGVAIAWAIAEHLHDAVRCRAMFATHYHELCELEGTRPGVVNFNVAAREHAGDVVFLHKLVRGPASRSYGVAVAKLAGVPEIVLARARAILGDLEQGAALPSGTHGSLRGRDRGGRAQLDLFAAVPPAPPASEVEATLRELDVDRMTPLDALVALARLRALLPPRSSG